MGAEGTGSRRRLLQALLLLPHPPLSLLYLTAVREERLTPSFTPLLALGVFPASAAFASVLRFTRAPKIDRIDVALGLIALLEIVWTVVALAMAGFTIAWRSG